LAGPVKVKVALVGQVVFGTEIVTCTGCPEDSVPLAGLKVMPFIPLLDALQFKVPCEPGAVDSVTVQNKQPSLILPGLTISCGGAQVHGILTVLAGPVKVKAAVAGQLGVGTITVIGIE
jgi:hypothetical protein